MVTASATPVQSKAHSSAAALLARYSDGSVVALSLSEPGRTYRVQLDPLSCECPGFQYRQCCYHVQAAVERFGQVEPEPACAVQCYTCGTMIPLTAAKVHGSFPGNWNHADFDACRLARASVRRSLGVW